jgi:hypothetical protein
MHKIITTLLLALLVTAPLKAQEHASNLAPEDNGSGIRIAGVIGHTLVNTPGMDNIFIPSWGLDVEYWFNHSWGIGMHNDVEIETFIVTNANGENVERVNPLVLTVDALYHFNNGFVITLGPGMEIEKGESFYLVRAGIEYEQDINKSFYLLPNLFLDQRLDGYNTWNIGLGVGLKL